MRGQETVYGLVEEIKMLVNKPHEGSGGHAGQRVPQVRHAVNKPHEGSGVELALDLARVRVVNKPHEGSGGRRRG